MVEAIMREWARILREEYNLGFEDVLRLLAYFFGKRRAHCRA